MENKIATKNIKTLIWQAGIPVIISMVLQALYNIIDTAFVINMDPILGEKANLRFPYSNIYHCNRCWYWYWNKCFTFKISWRKERKRNKNNFYEFTYSYDIYLFNIYAYRLFSC